MSVNPKIVIVGAGFDGIKLTKALHKKPVATIARNKALIDPPNFKFQGVFAWFVMMFVHILSLVGFRSKIVVFMDWSTNYLSYEKLVGVILNSAEVIEMNPVKEKIKAEV